MTSSNFYSSLYPFPIDLNEDDQHQQHQLFALKSQPPPSNLSSSSSLTYPIFFNPAAQEQEGIHQREPHQHFQHQEEAKIYVPQDEPLESESRLSLSLCRKEEGNESHRSENSSAKWMSSKMRIMRKMMSSDHADLSKFEEQKQQQPSSSPDNSSNSSYYNNNDSSTIRVCADCNTTKTPLWRSGPRGPKSLCNACGIRQRKARRAMAAAAAAAAAANGTINNIAAETTPTMKSKVQDKSKRSGNNGFVPQLKKKCKHGSKSQGRKKLCFEDLRIILSKNSAFHRVFPQDEKEAAILLMALSYGLVHG